VGIHWLLHSSCCFLNTHTATMRQLIRTARTLEAEWWQVGREAWVHGKRKMSQVLGAFGLLDFTMLWLILAWCAFWNLWNIYFFNFPNFWGATVNRGYGGSLLDNMNIILHHKNFCTSRTLHARHLWMTYRNQCSCCGNLLSKISLTNNVPWMWQIQVVSLCFPQTKIQLIYVS